MRRSRALSLLSILTAVLLVAATLMVFAQDRLFDADDFAATVGATLQDPEVNRYLADEVSAALIDQAPDLAVSGPLLADVTAAVLRSDSAAGIVETAARQAHLVVFDGGEDSLVLELSDLVVSVHQALRAISPDLAESMPDEVESLTVALSSGELTAGTVRLAERVRAVTAVLIVATSLAIAALVALDTTLFRGLARLGFTLGLVGLLLIVTVVVGAVVAASYGRTPQEGAALAAVWSLVLGDLVGWGWVLVVVGALLASLGWAVVTGGNVAGRARQLVERVVAAVVAGRGGVANTAAALALGVWALWSPSSLAAIVVRVAGFGLLVFGLAQVLERTGLAERLDRAGSTIGTSPGSTGPAAVGIRLGVTALVLGVLGFGAVALLANDDDVSALVDPDACNGHVELCPRRLDEVTLAAAHNSMSSTATGFYLPNHLSSMRTMLDVGVRGFMIDTVYGRPAPDGTVRTSLGLVDVDSLDAAARQAAEAVRARQSDDLGPEAVYLCHGFCEIGAIDAVAELTVLRDWLDDHPREVVVLIVQDATDPTDTAQAFLDAGFGELVHTQELGEPFPTLEEMIDSGRRVFVMVEEDGTGVDWLHPAFEFSQETPFSFASVDEFSCDPNRGRPDSPLFVVNHFITLARPSNQTINDAEVLAGRVEACAAARDRTVNLIAVDFASQGDVMAVVDRLNGVG